jgi:hypothetical protein
VGEISSSLIPLRDFPLLYSLIFADIPSWPAARRIKELRISIITPFLLLDSKG